MNILSISDETHSHKPVVLVTGGSGGIGRAVALMFGASGAAVVAQYRGNAERAKGVVEQIRAGGGNALSFRADVSQEQEVLGLFDAAESAFGGVDIVVHTAGVMPLAPVRDTAASTFELMSQANITGTFLVARESARRVRDGGSIVLFSTSITRLQSPTYGAYAMSKGAVESLPLILARELAGRDITVNAVAPGPTDTPLFREGKSPQLIEHIANLNPLGRLGTPEDIAQVVLSLTQTARWINGQVIYANGGVA